MSIGERLRRDGYVVMPGLLSPGEIDDLRGSLLDHFRRRWDTVGLGKHQPNAAVEIPSIGWIYSHPSILEVLRSLTDVDDLVFSGNSDAHHNMLSWWHKDTGESQGGCLPGNYFDRPECQVLRVGIYLQDHAAGHGLTVRRGSHRCRSLETGEVESLRTRAGDVVFFDIRITHAGQFADPVEALLLKASLRPRLQPLAVAIRHAYRWILRKPDKLSLFFTYGSPGPDIEYYRAFELAAKRANARAEHLPREVTRALRAAGVEVSPELA